MHLVLLFSAGNPYWGSVYSSTGRPASKRSGILRVDQHLNDLGNLRVVQHLNDLESKSGRFSASKRSERMENKSRMSGLNDECVHRPGPSSSSPVLRIPLRALSVCVCFFVLIVSQSLAPLCSHVLIARREA